MLRVLQILGDPTGGIRKHVHEIVRSLNGDEIEVHYAHGQTVDLIGKTDLMEFMSGNIGCLSLSIPKKPHILDVKNIYLLIRYCQAHRIDIVHGHGAKGGVYCRLVSLLLGIPCVYTPHGGSVHARYRKLESFLYSSVERLLRPITDLFLFESNYTLASFIKVSGELEPGQYRVNYNGVDCGGVSPVRRWSDNLGTQVNILVVGVLRDIKGQEIAIRALAKLAQTNAWNFRLHFCGDGPDRAKLESLVGELNLANLVEFHGEVADIAHWYEMCSIVVIPSLFESFGYVAIEASIMRRPVVAAAVGGLKEIVIAHKTGFLFPRGDSDKLAAEVLKVLSNIAASDVLVDSAERHVREKFCVDTMLQNIRCAYQDIVNISSLPLNSKDDISRK